jgi:hypothetical protein
MGGSKVSARMGKQGTIEESYRSFKERVLLL